MNSPDLQTEIEANVRFSLNEDIGSGDITAQLIPAAAVVSATIISKDNGILCGSAWVEEVFKQIDKKLNLNWQSKEGTRIVPGQEVLKLQGSARTILSGERTALNFLQTLSATASQSDYYSALVAHTKVKLLDTRKTLPGLRLAQKYAVKTGGCFNHRFGLYDAYLIKENHISACGGITAAITRAGELNPGKSIEVEVQNLGQLQEALTAKADIIMLDNFTLEDTLSAVETTAGQAKLEASGGINENTLVSVAETGVDYISIGALTKDCRAIDLSLLMD